MTLKGSVEYIPDTDQHFPLGPGKLLLQICLPGVYDHPRPRLLIPSVNNYPPFAVRSGGTDWPSRCCQDGPTGPAAAVRRDRLAQPLLSGATDWPSRVHQLHYSVTPSYNPSGVSWAFTAISATATTWVGENE